MVLSREKRDSKRDFPFLFAICKKNHECRLELIGLKMPERGGGNANAQFFLVSESIAKLSNFGTQTRKQKQSFFLANHSLGNWISLLPLCYLLSNFKIQGVIYFQFLWKMSTCLSWFICCQFRFAW